MYDCIIIGSGPAGLSAALNLKIYNKDFVWFGSRKLSDKVLKAEKVMNYPGLPGMTGQELFELFSAHIEVAQLEITEKTVTMASYTGSGYMVLADNEVYESKSLIICAGVVGAKELKGEDEFLGRGVSYCATCDGMFYKGKTIAVISNDPRFEHEVEYLADMAEKLYFFPVYKNAGVERENVEVLSDLPVEIRGGMKVGSLVLRSGAELALDGVFCLRNAIAPAKLLPQLETDGAHIVVDRECRTNLPGCFAAGDCTGRPYQYTKAVGEGNVAAHSCISFLAEHK